MIQTLVIGQVIVLVRVTLICHVTVSIHADHDRFKFKKLFPLGVNGVERCLDSEEERVLL